MSVIRKALLKKSFFELTASRALMPAVTATNAVRKYSDDNHPYIIKSKSSDVVVPEITIHEMFYAKTAAYENFTAIECSVTGKSYKFGEIRTKARNLSKFLRRKLNLQEGDTVAVLLPNVPDYLIAILGILEGNMIITSMNPLYTSEEVSKQLIDSGAKMIITNSAMYDNAKAAVAIVRKQIPIATIKMENGESLPEDAINFEEMINTITDIPDFEPGNAHNTTFLPYSSGTTGLPKGVRLSHYNIISNIAQCSHDDFKILIPPSESFQDVTPAVLPMFHIYGFTLVTFNSLVNGCKVVTMPKFTPENYISVLEKHKISVIYAAPPLVLFFNLHPGVKPEYMKHLRNITCGAAPLGSSDETRFLEKFGNHANICQGYGMTEASPLVTYYPKTLQDNLKKTGEGRGSIGVPVPNTVVKVINPDDPTGTPLGPNKVGELLIKGPQVMSGYHNKPKETAETFLDGWLRSGDMVAYNEKGMFYVADRLKELIKVKGFQVAPAELEEIVRTYPNVQDVAVIGIPHPVDGEVPRAYVVLKDKEAFSVDELQQFVGAKVAKYKNLRGGVEIVESIPKNPSGKILRRQLKLKYQEEQSN